MKMNRYTVQSLNDYWIPSLLSSNLQPLEHPPLSLFKLCLLSHQENFLMFSHLLFSISLVASFSISWCFFPFLRFLNISFSCSDLEIIFLYSLMILTQIFESRPSLRILLFHLSHCISSWMHQRQLKQQAPKWTWFSHYTPIVFSLTL